jgi:hypothetical protein
VKEYMEEAYLHGKKWPAHADTPSYVMQPQILKLTRTPRTGFKNGGVHSSPVRLQKDDNGPIHRTCVVKEYMEEAYLHGKKWPAHSLDLNIIENIYVAYKQA